MSRTLSIQPHDDGTYTVRFSVTQAEADVASEEIRKWAEGTRVALGWKHTYKNFGIAWEATRRGRPDLGEKLQRPGTAKGAIWRFAPDGGDWEVAVQIRGDILLDFAAILKTFGWPEEAEAIETAVGFAVPAYPQDSAAWADRYRKVLEPIYKRHFGRYRWVS